MRVGGRSRRSGCVLLGMSGRMSKLKGGGCKEVAPFGDTVAYLPRRHVEA